MEGSKEKGAGFWGWRADGGCGEGQLANSNSDRSATWTKNSEESEGDSKAGNKERGLGKRKELLCVWPVSYELSPAQTYL